MKLPKELIKEFVKGEGFKSTNDIMGSIRYKQRRRHILDHLLPQSIHS